MSNNKQSSSVEWLHIEFQKRFPKETAEMYNNNQLFYEQMIIQAKAMHKEEVQTAFRIGDKFASDYFGGNLDEDEKYYNETFGGDNEN